MKYLIMCEGSNEKTVIDLLVEKKSFVFGREELLNEEVFVARKLTDPQIILALNQYDKMDIQVLRIGDTQKDKFKVPKEYSKNVIQIDKICTKPELEILLIICFNLLKEFEKSKSSIKPKIFAKNNISYNGKKYDNSSKFYEDYCNNNYIDFINAIKEYKRVKGRVHKRDELFLADFIKY